MTVGAILSQIDEYMNDLDMVIMRMEDGTEAGTMNMIERCDEAHYGHVVITLNKLGDDSLTDSQLYYQLMEQDTEIWSEENNKTRNKMLSCFKDVSVIGLPNMGDTELDYENLSDRFKGGLEDIANIILGESPFPKTFSFGEDDQIEFNSTTSVSILSHLIEEANKGEIDLTGFRTFWAVVCGTIERIMNDAQEDLDLTRDLCQVESCPQCVCSFRQDTIGSAKATIDHHIQLAIEEAFEIYNVDITRLVEDLYEEKISPWIESNSCPEERIKMVPEKQELCDFSLMSEDFLRPEEDIEVICDYAFVCGIIIFDASRVHVITEHIYFAPQTIIDVLAPPKASIGKDGLEPGEDGGNGTDGTQGADVYFIAKDKLPGSSDDFTLILRGGDGGDGGTGADGKVGVNGTTGSTGKDGDNGKQGAAGDVPSLDDLPPLSDGPQNGTEVINHDGRRVIDSWSDHHHTPCMRHTCDEHDFWQHFLVNMTAVVNGTQGGPGGNGTDGHPGGCGGDGENGGQGGRGGDGGNGGLPGSVKFEFIAANPTIYRIAGQGGLAGEGGKGGAGGPGGPGGPGGKGGKGGEGGLGGMGLCQGREYYAVFRRDEECMCDILFAGRCDCDLYDYTEMYTTFINFPHECREGRGPKGSEGQAGADAGPGPDGAHGSQGDHGPSGKNGTVPSL